MREKKLLYAITFLMFLLLVRIFFISVINGRQLAKGASEQRTAVIELGKKRGVIYDRNMIPLTEGESRFFAATLNGSSKQGNASYSKNGVKIFELTDIEKVNKSKDSHLFSISRRYAGDGFLSHVIGYTSDDGGYGAEAVFNELLEVDGVNGINLVKDATDNIIGGLGLSATRQRIRNGVILSIDYHIQSAVEAAADKSEYPCAAVVVEIDSGDIVAMVSRPSFNTENIAASLNGINGELVNRAVSGYDAGSVFKTVVASAALEEGIASPKSTFSCTGEYKVGNTVFYCNKKQGHGTLTLSQGLEYSCNCVFYELGQKLGTETILKYARHFGFGTKILKADGFSESDGKLPTGAKSTGALLNLSIGQGELLITPLQAADMMCTVANGGVRKQLKIACGTADEAGKSHRFDSTEIDRVISESTASDLKAMLIGAVLNGTGQSARPECEAGGKTGSAESGWFENGEQMVHGWFVGFFPAENPKYVCSVLCENGKTGSSSASPIFKEIADSVCFKGKF